MFLKVPDDVFIFIDLLQTAGGCPRLMPEKQLLPFKTQTKPKHCRGSSVGAQITSTVNETHHLKTGRKVSRPAGLCGSGGGRDPSSPRPPTEGRPTLPCWFLFVSQSIVFLNYTKQGERQNSRIFDIKTT